MRATALNKSPVDQRFACRVQCMCDDGFEASGFLELCIVHGPCVSGSERALSGRDL